MEYQATFKSMAGLTVLLLFLAALFIGVGIQGHAHGMIVMGVLAIGFLLLIRIRFKVNITDSEIISKGFFETKRVNIDEIISGCWMIDYGYPKNRFYGPFVYEIKTPKTIMRINFKLFPAECMDNILKTMEERTPILAAYAATRAAEDVRWALDKVTILCTIYCTFKGDKYDSTCSR